MAHKTQIDWCLKIKKEYPEYFFKKRVLDIGSLDINGNNRDLFRKCEYIGIDVIEGKNVDVVSIAHKYESDKLFDVVMSTNSLEHDMHFKLTLKKMVELLKPKGLMFTTSPHIWREHGTKKLKPENSGTSQMEGEWANYYKTINIADITETLNIEKIFYECYVGISGRDFRFWGIKNGT
jgi:hypothetical protein